MFLFVMNMHAAAFNGYNYYVHLECAGSHHIYANVESQSQPCGMQHHSIFVLLRGRNHIIFEYAASPHTCNNYRDMSVPRLVP